MDLKEIFFLICFSIIYKKHFKDIVNNWLNPKNILKLSTSFKTIKLWINYNKIRDKIELATQKHDQTAEKVKNVI